MKSRRLAADLDRCYHGMPKVSARGFGATGTTSDVEVGAERIGNGVRWGGPSS